MPGAADTDEMTEIADPSGLSIDESDALLARLEADEAEVSQRRARLHDRIDFARQSAGNDTIATQRLDKLLADERDLAEQRSALHTQIAQLKAARRLAR
jgi:hypothetical protein